MRAGIERATQLLGLNRRLSGGRGKLRKLVDDPFAAHLPVDAATLECIRHWTISSCKFVKSSCSMDAMPPAAGPEFCFVGMSNAGKSSLINLLTGQERLANVSSKPGRTRVINHYLVNRRYCLVDCPGYGSVPPAGQAGRLISRAGLQVAGSSLSCRAQPVVMGLAHLGFAPVSKTEREAWNTVTQDYLLTRGPLAHVFLLIDATFPAHMLDIQAAMWLARKRVPHTLLFNKVDRPARPDDRALGDGAGDDEADGADDAWTMDAPSLTAIEHACMSAERSAVNKEWCANVSGGSSDEHDAAQNIKTCCAALRKLLSEQETELQEQWKQQGGAASSRLRPAQPPEHTPAYIVTSAKTRFGYATLLRYIAHMAEEWQRTAPVVFLNASDRRSEVLARPIADGRRSRRTLRGHGEVTLSEQARGPLCALYGAGGLQAGHMYLDRLSGTKPAPPHPQLPAPPPAPAGHAARVPPGAGAPPQPAASQPPPPPPPGPGTRLGQPGVCRHLGWRGDAWGRPCPSADNTPPSRNPPSAMSPSSLNQGAHAVAWLQLGAHGGCDEWSEKSDTCKHQPGCGRGGSEVMGEEDLAYAELILEELQQLLGTQASGSPPGPQLQPDTQHSAQQQPRHRQQPQQQQQQGQGLGQARQQMRLQEGLQQQDQQQDQQQQGRQQQQWQEGVPAWLEAACLEMAGPPPWTPPWTPPEASEAPQPPGSLQPDPPQHPHRLFRSSPSGAEAGFSPTHHQQQQQQQWRQPGGQGLSSPTHHLPGGSSGQCQAQGGSCATQQQQHYHHHHQQQQQHYHHHQQQQHPQQQAPQQQQQLIHSHVVDQQGQSWQPQLVQEYTLPPPQQQPGHVCSQQQAAPDPPASPLLQPCRPTASPPSEALTDPQRPLQQWLEQQAGPPPLAPRPVPPPPLQPGLADLARLADEAQSATRQRLASIAQSLSTLHCLEAQEAEAQAWASPPLSPLGLPRSDPSHPWGSLGGQHGRMGQHEAADGVAGRSGARSGVMTPGQLGGGQGGRAAAAADSWLVEGGGAPLPYTPTSPPHPQPDCREVLRGAAGFSSLSGKLASLSCMAADMVARLAPHVPPADALPQPPQPAQHVTPPQPQPPPPVVAVPASLRGGVTAGPGAAAGELREWGVGVPAALGQVLTFGWSEAQAAGGPAPCLPLPAVPGQPQGAEGDHGAPSFLLLAQAHAQRVKSLMAVSAGG
ncbi:hypothetical protein QJQ45_003158 [Haematococcus lacustris]|nr:hypothetical protein QJQ45_003158 [Haematococcus lacustris]